MAYPSQHMLTVIGGPLFTNEQWSISFRSTPNFGDTSDNFEGVIADMVPVISTWCTDVNSILGGQARLGFIKHNRIGTNGRYVNSVTGEHLFEPPVQAAGSSPHAPQVSMVATLETGLSRGLAHRGRVFLPAPRSTLGADGTIPVGTATAAAARVAALFTSLNGLTAFGTVSVYSDTREGASNPVTGVSVGRVLDTMRSRRAQLGEDRPPAAAVGGT